MSLLWKSSFLIPALLLFGCGGGGGEEDSAAVVGTKFEIPKLLVPNEVTLIEFGAKW